MEAALIAHFLASSGVSALIGQRLRPTLSGQSDVMPRAIITNIGERPEYHLGGQSDLAESKVRIDCMAQTARGALALARAFKAAVPKRPFVSGGISFSVFQDIEYDGHAADAATSRSFIRSIVFQVWHSEP